MKEIVDRILNGEAVNLAGGEYNVSVLKSGADYYVGFCLPEGIGKRSQILSTKQIKDAGNLLIALADELESRKKFKEGDLVYYVRPTNKVCSIRFEDKGTFIYNLILSENAFKTCEEAAAHKEEIMAKYQDLRDKGLV